MNPPSLSPDAIQQTAFGFWGSKVLLTAVEFSLFTTLGERRLTGAQLGDELPLHPRGIADFFDALVAMKFLDREGDGADAPDWQNSGLKFGKRAPSPNAPAAAFVLACTGVSGDSRWDVRFELPKRLTPMNTKQVLEIFVDQGIVAHNQVEEVSDEMASSGKPLVQVMIDYGFVTEEQFFQTIAEYLAAVPAKQRAAVVLTTYDGMNHAEAARVLGCSETTVSWRVFAARSKLKRWLRDLSPGRAGKP